MKLSRDDQLELLALTIAAVVVVSLVGFVLAPAMGWPFRVDTPAMFLSAVALSVVISLAIRSVLDFVKKVRQRD